MTTAVCLCFLIPATAACLYYFGLTMIGWRRTRNPKYDTQASFAIVIPAHNEELGLAATLRSVFASNYPPEQLRVLVIADNCIDRTADVARECGAECLERQSDTERGKGYALVAAIPVVLADKPDAVMILDADCELAPNTLQRFAAALADGAEAVQAARVPRNPGDGPAALVSAVGSVIENAVSAGRDRLGLTVALRGSGMAFTRGVLERFPWSSFGLTEDAEYAGVLTRAGVRVRFLADVEVRGEVPAEAAALTQQRRRWRAALWGGGPGLFARWVASKPLVLLHLALTVAVVGGLSPWMSLWYAGWAAALVALMGVMYLRALRRVGAGWRGLAGAVGIVAKLAAVTVGGALDRGRAWERTKRVAETGNRAAT